MSSILALSKRWMALSMVAALCASGSAAFAKPENKDDGKKGENAAKDNVEKNMAKPEPKKNDGGGEKLKQKGKGDANDVSAGIEKEIARLQDQLRKTKAEGKKSSPGGDGAKYANANKEGKAPKDGKREAKKGSPSKDGRYANLMIPASQLPPGLRKKFVTDGKGKDVMVPASKLPPGIARRFLNKSSKGEEKAGTVSPGKLGKKGVQNGSARDDQKPVGKEKQKPAKVNKDD